VSERSLKKTLLIIDDDRIFCETIKDYLAGDALEVLTAHTAKEGLAACSSGKIDVVLLDQNLPDGEGHTLCPDILKCNDQAKIIFATAYPSFENAVKALKAGANDYLSKPFELEELNLAVNRAFRTLELERVEQIQDYQTAKAGDEAVIIGGKCLVETVRLVELAASSASPVLITGETGTGKTLVAKVIHYQGLAGKAPFISINCAALPENLIEAELFGYEKGAFTSAVAKKRGIFEMAEGGTLFLDEIGEMPLHLQAKLLSVIEDKQVRRLGSESVRPVNVRVMAATSADLENCLGKTFRKDLYYRLSVIRIHIPPLRERRECLPLLCDHLLRQLTGSREIKIDDQELSNLKAYDWPGNVRELKNILERAVILQGNSELRPSELIGNAGGHDQGGANPAALSRDDVIATLEEIEKKHIQQALTRLSGNITQTAKALGISLSTLKRKIKDYGLK
jgi:DNA-binding NtrC family response regulator